MSELDDLIAQCQAAPDDDTPRLAWAQAVGGERGELVVVQCRLAHGAALDRDEWRRLRVRERELLAANGVTWSGLGDAQPMDCVFRRGFVDAVQIVCTYDTRLDPLLAAVPLARSVANDLVLADDELARLPTNPRCAELAALRIGSGDPTVGDQTIAYLVDRGIALRALSIVHCSRVGTRRLVASGLLDNVERLELGAVEEPARLLSATPRLRALRVRGALDGYAAAIPRTVVELVWHASGGLAPVAALAIAPTLERLRLDAPELTWDLEAFAAFPALRSLDLSWAKLAPGYQPFAMERPNLLPSLRELSLPRWIDEKSVETVARTIGPRLDTLHWSGRLPHDLAGLERPLSRHLRAAFGVDAAPYAALVGGELLAGALPPWTRRPLELGDCQGPWFECGGVSVR